MISNCKMNAQNDPSLGKLGWFFRGKRHQDSLWSWVVCFSAMICNALGLGFALSYGVLLPALMDYFDETRERTAGLGSLALSLTFFLTPLPGYISDRFGCRITNFVGATLCMTGLVTSSFVQSLTLMFLTHGLLMGLGISFIYSSCFLVIAKYFKEKLSVATGIVALGAGFGVFFTGPLLQVLLDSYGWRATYRIMVVSFIVVCILGLTYNPNVQETTLVTSFNNDQDKEDKMSRISLYCSLWRFPTFVALVTSMLLTGVSIYIPLIFLVKYAEDHGITAQAASLLFIFIGLLSSLGRAVAGMLYKNKKVNPIFIHQASLLTLSLCVCLLPFSTSYWSLILFSIVYGFSDGVFITGSLYIPLSCVESKRKTASFCTSNFLYSLGAVSGSPIAGMIVDHTGSYVHAFYMSSAVAMAAFLIPMILIPINRKKSKVHPQDNMKEDPKMDKAGSEVIENQNEDQVEEIPC